MNLILILYIVSAILKICASEDYVPPTYDPDVSRNTNDYSNTNNPNYDNPYDVNRKYQNREKVSSNRNQYDVDQRYNQYENRNEPKYNQNPYNPENTPRPSWDSSRGYSASYKSAALEYDSVIIHEA